MSDLGVPESTFFDLQNRWFNDQQQPLHKKKHLLKNKISMPVNECRYMFGCALESELESNQCFIRYQVVDNDGKPLQIPKFETVVGQVIVTKNSCPYAGDMLTLQAVDRSELHCLNDVIVFSTKGKQLRLLRKVEPLDYKPSPTNDHSISKLISPLESINHCLSMLDATLYGEVYNLHQIIVDKNEEKSEQRTCQQLAKEMANMFSDAIDSCKTGCLINKTRIEQIRAICGPKYPDFLMKKPCYESQSILGRLYRNALDFNKKRTRLSNTTIAKIKQEKEKKKIQNGKNNLTGVICNICGKICKNNVVLRIHKGTCDKKEHEIKSDISSAIIQNKNITTITITTATTGKSRLKIIDLLTKNSDGTYNCPNIGCQQSGKAFQSQGITSHVKSCAKEWLIQKGFQTD